MLKDEIGKVLSNITCAVCGMPIDGSSYKDQELDISQALIAILGLVENEKIDWDMIEKDIAPMVDVNVHGHINSPKEYERMPVISRIGKECSEKIAKGIVAYLKCVISPKSKGG